MNRYFSTGDLMDLISLRKSTVVASRFLADNESQHSITPVNGKLLVDNQFTYSLEGFAIRYAESNWSAEITIEEWREIY